MPVAPGHPRKHHTLAEKQAFVAEIERGVKEGRAVRAVARELGIAPGNYYRWLQEGVRRAVAATEVPEAFPEKPVVMPAPADVAPRERARIVAAVRAGLAEGISVKITAKRLGITEGVYYRWVRAEARTAAARPSKPAREPDPALAVVPWEAPVFRAVTLVEPPTEAAPGPLEPLAPLVLVAPSGHRIEGLGIASAAALLRALS